MYMDVNVLKIFTSVRQKHSPTSLSHIKSHEKNLKMVIPQLKIPHPANFGGTGQKAVNNKKIGTYKFTSRNNKL